MKRIDIQEEVFRELGISEKSINEYRKIVFGIPHLREAMEQEVPETDIKQERKAAAEVVVFGSRIENN